MCILEGSRSLGLFFDLVGVSFWENLTEGRRLLTDYNIGLVDNIMDDYINGNTIAKNYSYDCNMGNERTTEFFLMIAYN